MNESDSQPEEPQLSQLETERLRALRQLELLDTPAEERFDRIVRLTRRLLGVPVALISLVDEDRQWFKASAGLSEVGVDARETPRDIAFCQHTIEGESTFVVPDALEDPRFRDNPLVVGNPHIRFYAGLPLHTPDGYRIGTLCIIDHEPRTLTADEELSLTDLRGVAERELTALALASLDPLTRLPNRAGLEHLAPFLINDADERHEWICGVFIDINGLKEVNDREGHNAGDVLIADLGRVLQMSTCGSEICARVGGDEFFLLADASRIDEVLDQVRYWIDERNHSAEIPLVITIGCARLGPHENRSLQDLMTVADAAMYAERRRLRGGAATAGVIPGAAEPVPD